MGRLPVPPPAALLSAALALLSVLPVHARAEEAPTPAYVSIGDALAFGVGVQDSTAQGFVPLAHRAIQTSAEYRDRGLELINLAAAGAVSGDLLLEGGQVDAAIQEVEKRLADDVEDNSVEIISVTIGANDLLSLVTVSSPCLADPEGEECLQTFAAALSDLQMNLGETLERLREAAPAARILVVGLANPYSGTGDELEETIGIAIGQANGVIAGVAGDPALDVTVVEIAELFEGRGGQWISAGGIHPNEAGHRVIAEALVAAFEGREPQIPPGLMAETPAPVSQTPLSGPLPGGDNGGGVLLWLAIAAGSALGGGAVLFGAYRFARGR